MKSNLIYRTDDTSQEIVVDAGGEEVSVVIGVANQIVVETMVRASCPKDIEAGGRGLTVLNDGFGLGIYYLWNHQLDSIYQSLTPLPPNIHGT